MYSVVSILAYIGQEWKDYEKIPDPGPTPTTWNIGQMLSIVNTPANKGAMFYITVTHPDFTDERQVKFSAIPDLLDHTADELDVYLNTDPAFATHTLTTLPEDEVRSIVNPKSIKYWDCTDFGFDFLPAYIAVGGEPIGQYKPDLEIVNGLAQLNTPANILNSYLVAINGRVYLPELINDKVYVRRGWVNLNPVGSNDRNHGIIDFTEVGEFIPEVIQSSECDILFSSLTKTTIRVKSSVSLKNHTTFLVVDGVWRFADWKKLDDEYVSITIRPTHAIALANQSAELLSWIDPATLLNGGYDLSSFDGIEYVSQGNSFFVHLPKQELAVFKEQLGRTEFDSHFTHYRIPRGLLFLSDGTLGHYRVDGAEQLECSILSSEPVYRRFYGDTVPEGLQNNGFTQIDLAPDAVQASVWHHDYYFAN